MTTKILCIDDDEVTIKLMKGRFVGELGVVFEECHTFEEAMNVIKKYEPPFILLLDNDLTHGGNEGMRIVELINSKNIKVISTTMNDIVSEKLDKEYGIKTIFKGDEEAIRNLLKESDQNRC